MERKVEKVNSLLYLYKRTIINRIRYALKKPITYVAVIGVIAYAVMIIKGFGIIFKNAGVVDEKGIAAIITLVVFFAIPGDILSYVKKKGMIFRKSDVHFVFQSPENPKKVLLFAGIKNFVGLSIIGLVIAGIGVFVIKIPWMTGLLFFLVFAVLENLLEGSMMVIFYANETLSSKIMEIIKYSMYACMGIFVAVGAGMILIKGFSAHVVMEYLMSPYLEIVPFAGWLIGVVRLIALGATPLHIICSVLYLVSVIGLFFYARKMPCSGAYYEDAMKFAEEYATLRQKKKKGENTFRLKNKKTYVKDAAVEYKGSYAKAIYYRQLLEYKKNRFFIFGGYTLICLGVGVVLAYISHSSDFIHEFGKGKIFVIPAVIAYLLFIFSGYATKWSKELENPYTFLIPDSPFKKMWYATIIEHIRAVIDGILITLPAAIVLKLNALQIVLTILVYICLNANKLYMNMLADVLAGHILGNTGRMLVKIFVQGLVMVVAILGAVFAGGAFGYEAGFIAMITITFLLTFAGALGASAAFERMEVRE